MLETIFGNPTAGKMKSKLVVCCVLFSSVSSASPVPKYGPAGSPFALPLPENQAYLKSTARTDFWNVNSFYQGMEGGHSASAVSVVIALNALRDQKALMGSDQNIDESSVLKLDKTGEWKKKITGKHPTGVGLEELSGLSMAAVKNYLGEKAKVELLSAKNLSKLGPEEWKKLMSDNEQDQNSVMIVHYKQSIFTDDPEGAVGTFSPVGAYDAEAGRVLIMETDRKYYSPYWISLDRLKKGLIELISKKGHASGGILIIRKE